MFFIIIRSLLFKVLFYFFTLLQMFFFLPFIFISHSLVLFLIRFWIYSVFWLQKYIVGTTYEIQGKNNLPTEKGFIVASKHQSIWDTLILVILLKNPTFILKNELMKIPIIKHYLKKIGVIPIHRSKKINALKIILYHSKKKENLEKQIVIFPEGTRKNPGDAPQYKTGIFAIYSDLNLPVICIAHNAGIYWPNKTFLHFPGTIKFNILPKIDPGLNKKEFMRIVEKKIESSCNETIIAAARDPMLSAMPLSSIKKLKNLGIKWKGKIQ